MASKKAAAPTKPAPKGKSETAGTTQDDSAKVKEAAAKQEAAEKAKAEKEAAAKAAAAKKEADKAAKLAEKTAKDAAKAAEKAKADAEKAAKKAEADKARAAAQAKMAEAKEALKAARDAARAAGGGSTKGPEALRAAAGRYTRDSEHKTAGGNISVHSGDPVAKSLLSKPLDEVYKIASKTIDVPVKELQEKYGHLNVGMQRMNLGNRMRGVLNAK